MDEDTNLNLFQEGLQSYFDALAAINEFQCEVHSRSRQVLEANFDRLGEALHANLERDLISNFVGPTWGSWDGTYAWIAAKLAVRDLGNVYLGLHWRAEDGKPVGPGVAVDFELWQTRVFRPLSQKLRSLAGDRMLAPFQRELTIWEPLDPVNAVSFGETLNSILKEWIELWSKIPPADYQTPPKDH